MATLPHNPARAAGATNPAAKAVKLTAHDTNTFAVCRGLLVGTAGTADVTFWDDTEAVDLPLQAGYNPLSIKRFKTGKTASDVWALY